MKEKKMLVVETVVKNEVLMVEYLKPGPIVEEE